MEDIPKAKQSARYRRDKLKQISKHRHDLEKMRVFYATALAATEASICALEREQVALSTKPKRETS